jgi:thioredoxin 1
MIAPKFSEFSNKYTNATFVHIDVDEVTDHPHVAAVSGVPHFKFFKAGKLITEFSGANVQTLEKTIQQNA